MFKTLSHSSKDAQLIKKSARASSEISTARKVDRLLRSLVDIQEALDILNNSELEQSIKLIAITSALCSAYHWFTENQIFLSRIGVLEHVDTKAVALSGSRFDLVGTVLALYLLCLKMGEERDKDKQHLHKVKCFGMCCDIVHSLDDSGVLSKVIGRELNAGEYGIVGVFSAVATLYRCCIS